jgi:hypothetical protein
MVISVGSLAAKVVDGEDGKNFGRVSIFKNE